MIEEYLYRLKRELTKKNVPEHARLIPAKEYEEIRSYLPGGKRRKQDSRTTQLTNSTVKSLFGYLRVQGTFALIVGIVSWIYLT